MVERVETGIEGLDGLIQGGLPQRSVTLVTGGAGTGKTIFSSQYLWGSLQKGKNCLYITLEEEPEEIREDANEFGWDFSEYEEKNQFKIEYMNPLEGRGFESRIEELVEEIGADRVVLDSISVIGMYSNSVGKVRERVYEIIRMLRRMGVTTILTSESPSGEEDKLSRYGVEEFVCDGLIVLNYLGIGEGSYRTLQIRKMRRTNQKKDLYPFSISESGIKVEKS